MKHRVRTILAVTTCAAFGLLVIAVSSAFDAPTVRQAAYWADYDQPVRLPPVVESASQDTVRRLPEITESLISPTPSDVEDISPYREQDVIKQPLLSQPDQNSDEGKEFLPAGKLPDLHEIRDDLGNASTSSVPWWQNEIGRPLRGRSATRNVDVEMLVIEALQYSPRIQAISDMALISETSVTESLAEFDVNAYMESKYSRSSDPVGSTLTTGGPLRSRDRKWSYEAGLRKKMFSGASLELSQRIGLDDSNSLFFLPPDQGNARLSLSFEQPLLNGAGKAYNYSLTLLAQIDTQVAWNRSAKELQAQLVQINDAYWELYLQRAALLQKQRLLQRAEEILEELEARSDIDALQSQVVRARSAVATRRAELVRASASIRNAETRIRSLVNTSNPQRQRQYELIPVRPPMLQDVKIDMDEALVTALKNRPEIDEAMRQVRAANVRVRMAKNELLPALNAVVEAYASGLEGNNDIGKSFGDQFSEREPGYTAGLTFEVPLYRRAAKAAHRRRQIELRQLTRQFEATVSELNAEVEFAVREVHTSYLEMQSKYLAMQAAYEEVQYLQERWKLLPGEDRSASFLLEDLLDAQGRLAAEEFELARSQVAYAMALTKVKQAMGTLLQSEQITPQRVWVDGLPQMQFEKQTAQPNAPTPMLRPQPASGEASLRYPLPTR